MLIKGQEVSNIKLGNTLSDDQLAANKFDLMLSNPPFGVEWKKVQKQVTDEHKHRGFDGRFGPGLPRVSDGSRNADVESIGEWIGIREVSRHGKL
ncbi:N-6 DNA methylase [Spongiibacter sp.]|uniref:N-6 DNA methylase n=1 Tax=Spongiibacter sp. TaxID=2024860 RepID=UPI00257BE7C7|nr:N-6 DNA methylase [Spongiibacter sp.]|tara:strand:- start:1292 stop:1576 length:285 start_codon:yes stop_codon:yes gene_type:complete